MVQTFVGTICSFGDFRHDMIDLFHILFEAVTWENVASDFLFWLLLYILIKVSYIASLDWWIWCETAALISSAYCRIPLFICGEGMYLCRSFASPPNLLNFAADDLSHCRVPFKGMSRSLYCSTW